MILVSRYGKKENKEEAGWDLPANIFKNNDPLFKFLAAVIALIIISLYLIFW